MMTVKDALEIVLEKVKEAPLGNKEVDAIDVLRVWLELDCKTPSKKHGPRTPKRGIGVHSNSDMFRGK